MSHPEFAFSKIKQRYTIGVIKLYLSEDFLLSYLNIPYDTNPYLLRFIGFRSR